MRRFGWLPALFFSASTAAAQGFDVGFFQLRDALKDDFPSGAGVKVTQIEAQVAGGAYFPDPAYSVFAGMTITNVSGISDAPSGHATGVAEILVGDNYFTGGVTQLDVYEALDWLLDGGLRAVSPHLPRVETSKVTNSSWIGSFSPSSDSIDVLRRLDYAIERDGFLAVVGVNNGAQTTIPDLLANAYNAVAVGLTSGGSSVGPSTLDVPGRSTPHVVVPMYSVSNGVPVVGSAAIVLVDAAQGNAAALRPESIKAFLMTGATKAPFDLSGATPSTLDDWSHSPTQPLDDRLGAGELDIFNSYNILKAGQQEAGATTRKTTGWDQAVATPAGQKVYFFNILEGQTASELSATAVWNRHIQASSAPGNPSAPLVLTPSLAQIDLRLHQASGATLGPLVAESISTIDNVEHLYLRDLAPGRYALAVSSDRDWDYTLAWQAHLAGPPAYVSVASSGTKSIVQFDPAGTQAPFADAENGLLTPLGVAIDPQGNRFVADWLNNKIVKFDNSGNGFLFADGANGLLFPTSLAVDGGNQLLVANYLAGQLIRLDANGGSTVVSDANRGLGRPLTVAVDPVTGQIYVAEPDARRVVRLDASGNAIVVADASDGLLAPAGLAFSPTGELFVADSFQQTIFRLDEQGQAAVFADAGDQLVLPFGLAFDADGNLLVSDYGAGKILRFDPFGVGSVFADSGAGLRFPFGLAAGGGGIRGDRSPGLSIASVPEPGSLVLTGIAAAALVGLGSRVRRAGQGAPGVARTRFGELK